MPTCQKIRRLLTLRSVAIALAATQLVSPTSACTTLTNLAGGKQVNATALRQDDQGKTTSYTMEFSPLPYFDSADMDGAQCLKTSDFRWSVDLEDHYSDIRSALVLSENDTIDSDSFQLDFGRTCCGAGIFTPSVCFATCNAKQVDSVQALPDTADFQATGSLAAYYVHNVTCLDDVSVTGKYVTLSQASPGAEEPWTICGLKIVGRGAERKTGLRNLALDKPARQATTMKDRYAYLAVDGNRTQVMQDHFKRMYCTHTRNARNSNSTHGLPSWWRVDLGQSFPVTHLLIYNRVDLCKCEFRLQNFSIAVGMEDNSAADGVRYEECYYHVGPAGAVVNASCSSPVCGRYVRILKEADDRSPLTLCEVEVYSSFVAAEVPATTTVATTRELVTSETPSTTEKPDYSSSSFFATTGSLDSDLTTVTGSSLDSDPTIVTGSLDSDLTTVTGSLDSDLTTVTRSSLDSDLTTVTGSSLDSDLTTVTGSSLDSDLTTVTGSLDSDLTTVTGSLDSDLTTITGSLDSDLTTVTESLDSDPTGLTSPTGSLDSDPTGLTSPTGSLDSDPTGLTSPTGSLDSDPTGLTSPTGLLDSDPTDLTSPTGSLDSDPTGLTSPTGSLDSDPTGLTSPTGSPEYIPTTTITTTTTTTNTPSSEDLNLSANTKSSEASAETRSSSPTEKFASEATETAVTSASAQQQQSGSSVGLIPKLTETPPHGPTARPDSFASCDRPKCRCAKIDHVTTPDEISSRAAAAKEAAKKIARELLWVAPETKGASYRKKNSVSDERPTSKWLGIFSVVFVGIVAAVVVLPDFLGLVCHVVERRQKRSRVADASE